MVSRCCMVKAWVTVFCAAFAFVPYACSGGGFLVPGTNSLDCLEIEEGYATDRKVTVPLVRDAGLPAEIEILSANGVNHQVEWAEGDTRKFVDVALPAGLKASDEVLLALGSGSEVSATSRIAVVAPVANGLANPWWLGERSADALGWGEWTMDLAAATSKVAAASGEAFTLVYFSGVLWCPWCQGLEKGVLGTEAFKAWCAAHKVALVVLDNPRRSATDHISGDPPYTVSTVPDGKPPTLLRYDSGKNNVIGCMVSGASYLSRKGISVVEAEAKLQENHTLGYRGGAFAAPEAWRTGYPTMILLRKDGTIAGRFNSYGPTTTSYDTDENMARLDDLLKLAGGKGDGDNYVTTTTRSLKCGERVDGCVFQINDTMEAFRLEFIPKASVEFRISGKTVARPVKLSVVRLENGEQKILASGTDAVTCDFSNGEPGAVFLKLTAFGEEVKYGKDTTFSLNLESAVSSASETGSDCATILYAGFAHTVNLSTNVCSIPTSGSVKLKILSGKMPAGVKLFYNEEVGSVFLSGTAKKAGEYRVEYPIEGGTASVAFSVKDPAAENPNLSRPWTMTLPLLRSRENGQKEMYGALTLSAKANNSLSAKYACTAFGKAVSFKGRWNSMIGGIASAELVAKSGERLLLDLAANGQIEARILDARYPEGLDSGILLANTGDSGAAFGGTYTVALPENGGMAGPGYLILSIGGAQGKVKWKGMLGNGQSVGGSAVLVKDANGLGLVPVFRVDSKCMLSAPLVVRPNAGAVGTRRAVRLADGTVAVWAAGGSMHDCRAWGSWFSNSDSLAEMCLDSSLPTMLQIWFDGNAAGASDTYGKLVSLPSASVTVTDATITFPQKSPEFRLTCRRKDGVFKGSVKIGFENRTVTAKYAGVFIPGWYDCGCEVSDPEDLFDIVVSMPFAIGTAFYPDKSSGDAGKRSFAVQIGEKTE